MQLLDWSNYLALSKTIYIQSATGQFDRHVSLTFAIKNKLPFRIYVRGDILALSAQGSDGGDQLRVFGERYPQFNQMSFGTTRESYLLMRIARTERRSQLRRRAIKEGLIPQPLIPPPFSADLDGNPYLPDGECRYREPHEVFESGRDNQRLVFTALVKGWPVEDQLGGLHWLADQMRVLGLHLDDFVTSVLANPAGAGKCVSNLEETAATMELRKFWDQAVTNRANSKIPLRVSDWFFELAEQHPHVFLKHSSVIFGIASISLRVNRIEFDLSVRELAIESGCGRDTANTALKLLEWSGIIRVVSRGTRRIRMAKRYRLVVEIRTQQRQKKLHHMVSVSEEMRLVQDCLTRKPMQLNTYLILRHLGWSFLQDMIKGHSELSRKVDRAIKNLVGSGLVDKSTGEPVAIIDSAVIASIALRRGTIGAGEARFIRYQKERERYRPRLADEYLDDNEI
jgi:DNA-binding transcriptional regulator YhcF (GntR family)